MRATDARSCSKQKQCLLCEEIDAASRNDEVLVTPRCFANAVRELFYLAYTKQLIKANTLVDAIVSESVGGTWCKRFPVQSARVIHEAAFDWLDNETSYLTTLSGGYKDDH